MKTFSGLVGWMFAAAAVLVGFWLLRVYLFNDFDRGYGQTTWLLLQLYQSAILTLFGLVGFAISATLQKRLGSVIAPVIAGAIWAIAMRLLGAVFERWSPDADMLIETSIGALVLGAISVFAMRK